MGKEFDGYLKSIENENENTVATVSVVSDEMLKGDATVEVFGSIAKNTVVVPKEYVFYNKSGKKCVMIAKDGYLVERKIETGTLSTQNGIEIKKGLLEDEKIVVNHKSLKTGDKYK